MVGNGVQLMHWFAWVIEHTFCAAWIIGCMSTTPLVLLHHLKRWLCLFATNGS